MRPGEPGLPTPGSPSIPPILAEEQVSPGIRPQLWLLNGHWEDALWSQAVTHQVRSTLPQPPCEVAGEDVS